MERKIIVKPSPAALGATGTLYSSAEGHKVLGRDRRHEAKLPGPFRVSPRPSTLPNKA